MNAYQLRFQMLQTAREMLEAEYHAKTSAGQKPEWPQLKDVIQRATELNKFVSEN